MAGQVKSVRPFLFKGKAMFEEWWKVFAGMFATALGFVIKDAVRDGKMAVRMDTAETDIKELQELYDSKPCASEILCKERRQECSADVRRQFDSGVSRFDKLEKCIQSVDQSAQRRHEDMMKILLEMSK
jgi:hypothetical protein